MNKYVKRGLKKAIVDVNAALKRTKQEGQINPTRKYCRRMRKVLEQLRTTQLTKRVVETSQVMLPTDMILPKHSSLEVIIGIYNMHSTYVRTLLDELTYELGNMLTDRILSGALTANDIIPLIRVMIRKYRRILNRECCTRLRPDANVMKPVFDDLLQLNRELHPR